jgi:hypothetical protein
MGVMALAHAYALLDRKTGLFLPIHIFITSEIFDA